MKILVTYFTQTNNTKRIAEAIFNEIDEEKEIIPLNKVKSLEGYDFAFIGFPVHGFGPAKKAADFIKKHAKEKDIAIFVTHAMPPDNPMLKNLLKKCQKPAEKSKLVDFYHCQGELAEKVANMLIDSGNPQMAEFGKMRNMTVGHPNDEEVEKARQFAKDTLQKIGK
jgi:flavodoxin